MITGKFVEAIQTTGKLPWQKPWRCLNPFNAVSGKQYNGINLLMLSFFGTDNAFITFNQAKENGGSVKKGAKGFPIVYFKFLDKKVNGKLVMAANGKPEQVPMMRYSTVFGLSDIDGCDTLKAKSASKGKAIEFAPIEACQKLIENFSIPINHGGNSASYSPLFHRIDMPAKESFSSVELYYVTLFHEIGHSIAKELGEDLSANFGSDPYAKEELVAELFASFCLAQVGIDSTDLFNHSLAYLQSWQKKLMDDSNVLISAASKATKRFNWLLASQTQATEQTTENMEIA